MASNTNNWVLHFCKIPYIHKLIIYAIRITSNRSISSTCHYPIASFSYILLVSLCFDSVRCAFQVLSFPHQSPSTIFLKIFIIKALYTNWFAIIFFQDIFFPLFEYIERIWMRRTILFHSTEDLRKKNVELDLGTMVAYGVQAK